MELQGNEQLHHDHHDRQPAAQPLLLALADLNRDALSLAGGKAANLGELLRAGLPVPPGFCITTVAYTLAAEQAGLGSILAAQTPPSAGGEEPPLTALAQSAAACFLSAPIPPDIAEAIVTAYQALGDGKPVAVAVRSSATTEDLPGASFAGQQETYLNILGAEALLDAVRKCWASLWTERAVTYRDHLGIDQRSVRLAVVVQCMVQAAVAGVLFTANPLTGKRRQAVIDANPGLGEAVVSGATNPDHFVVTPATGEIVERRPGDKRVVIHSVAGGGTQKKTDSVDRSGEACLSDAQLRALAALGAQVEAHYGVPQDIEWALDDAGRFWLTQARPITTLFPLPDTAPRTDAVLRAYFSVNVLQGVYRPFTPMGLSAARLFGSSIATLLGYPPRNPQQGPGAFAVAASRIFLDVTPALRHAIGRALIIRVGARFAEARSAALFEQVVTDPRLSIVSRSRRPLLRLAFHLLVKRRFLLYLAQALLRPSAAQARVGRIEAKLRALGEVSANASAAEYAGYLAASEHLLSRDAASRLLALFPVPLAGLALYGLASRLLKDLATPDELQMVLRGLPYNPTTEMDLALWALAQQVRADPVAAACVRETSPGHLAQAYREERLPPTLQQGLAQFLRTYGHRGVAEIDLGLPRWSEDPTHLLGVLANYLHVTDPALAPDTQFQRSAQEAEAMVAELTRRAARKSRWLGIQVNFCLTRTRALAGGRERPKFDIVLVLARARKLLCSVGEALARAGQVEAPEDIFFLTLQEARAALEGADMRATIHKRRAEYEHELKRQHIPRVLLSDGTEPVAEPAAVSRPTGTARALLQGTPASPGKVTAPARVILDPTAARLEPGEILVAPSTDPGWTPLFLTAGGLVMEMGGAMSHGAVVAREYGIPAVVGAPGATARITTGQLITVDGSAGSVTPAGQDEVLENFLA
ncbi:MAG: PEP/pyruvate-binding domain-containing protein [Ktedonobacterales bacterium]